MFDTHCHLDSYLHSPSDFSTTPDFNYLAVSTKPSNWLPLIAFCKTIPNVYCALGIHPWFVQELTNDSVQLLEHCIKQNSVSAIGEIGLDFLPEYKVTKSIQLQVFESQLSLAQKYNKPVSLHIVKAHNQALGLLHEHSVNGVVHGLGASKQLVQQYLDLGLKIGINGVSVKTGARRYHELIKYCGVHNLVLETDFPNIILPNHLAASLSDLNVVAEHAAGLLNISFDEFIRCTDVNAKQLFIES